MALVKKIANSPERSFGKTFAVFFLIVAAISTYKTEKLAIALLAVSLVFLAFGLIAPNFLKYPNKIWMKFGELLHKITTPFILGLMFFGVFLPFGFLLRTFNFLAIQLKFDPKAQTYWKTKEKAGPEPETMKYSF